MTDCCPYGKAYMYGKCVISGPQGPVGSTGPTGPTGPVSIFSYGCFTSANTQNVAGINTPTVVSFDTIVANNNITLNGNNEIVFHSSGIYNIIASPEIVSDKNQSANCYIWFRKNNQDIPLSASKTTVTDKTEPTFTSVPFMINLQANDTIQTLFSSNDHTVALGYFSQNAEGYMHPAVPSMILTCQQIS